MKYRIGHRSIEVRDRVQGGVEVTQKSIAVGSNPAPAPYKSKLEAHYAQYLDALKFGKVIDSWQYEPLNFRLPGKKNFYKPDFLVQAHDKLTFVDVKGRNKSDDRSLVKIKTIAGLNRWARFVQVRYVKGAWIERVIE